MSLATDGGAVGGRTVERLRAGCAFFDPLDGGLYQRLGLAPRTVGVLRRVECFAAAHMTTARVWWFRSGYAVNPQVVTLSPSPATVWGE